LYNARAGQKVRYATWIKQYSLLYSSRE